MNKSKIAAYSAIATVMSATAAHADLSLSGAMAGVISSGDNSTGVGHAVTTSSVYVSYSSTLDNGMGMSAGFSVTGGANNYSIALDTGMGSVAFGQTHSSAVDKADGMPAGVNTISSTTQLGSYNDGDSAESMGIRYTSPSVQGFTLGLSMGDNTCSSTSDTVAYVAAVPVPGNPNHVPGQEAPVVTTTTTTCNDDRVSSMALKGSVAGVGLAIGQVDQIGEADDTFYTVGYSVAGVSLGMGVYNSDGDGESTVYGLNTSFGGFDIGMEFEDWDSGSTASDQDMSKYSIGKDLGGMAVTLIYEDTDAGGAVDNQNFKIFYSVGF
jgi:hypothetical protein